MTIRAGETRMLLRKWLLDDVALGAVAGINVLGNHVEDADAGTLLASGPLVIFGQVAGAQHYPRALEKSTYDLYCYSRVNADECFRIYELACDRLQMARIAVAGIATCGSAREIERPMVLRHDPLGAWAARGRWAITMLTDGVPMSAPDAGPIPSTVVPQISVVVVADAAGTFTAATILPAGARVFRVYVVVEAMDGGATAEIGFSDDLDSLVTTTSLDAATLAEDAPEDDGLDFHMDRAATGTRQVIVTVHGAPTTGSIRATVFYAVSGA